MRLFSYLTYLIALAFSIIFGLMLVSSQEMSGIAVVIYEIIFFLIYFLIIIFLSIISYRRKQSENGKRLLLSIPISIIIIVVVFIISERKMQNKFQIRQKYYNELNDLERINDSIKTEELIKLVDDSIKNDKNNCLLYVKRGLLEVSRGNYDKSIYFYDKAIKIDTGFINAYIEAGLSSISKYDYKSALKYYEKAYKIDTLNSEYKEKVIWLKTIIFENRIETTAKTNMLLLK